MINRDRQTPIVEHQELGMSYVTSKPTRGDQLIRIALIDAHGKTLAHLYPDKKVSNKKAFAVRLMYYNDKKQRCTRFLCPPKKGKTDAV